MDILDTIIYTVDSLLDTERKRHIVGGTLLSISLLFGGFACTVMTIKNEEDNQVT